MVQLLVACVRLWLVCVYVGGVCLFRVLKEHENLGKGCAAGGQKTWQPEVTLLSRVSVPFSVPGLL